MASSAALQPMSSTPGVHRIKRKPAPSIDAAALFELYCPSPDPSRPLESPRRRTSLAAPPQHDISSASDPFDDEHHASSRDGSAHAYSYELQPSPPLGCMLSYVSETDVTAASRPNPSPHYRKRSNTIGLASPASPLPSITSHLNAKGSPTPSGSSWRLFTPPAIISRQASSGSSSSGSGHHHTASTPNILQSVDEDGTSPADTQASRPKLSRLFFLSKRRVDGTDQSPAKPAARVRKASISLPLSVELPPGAPQNLIPIADVKRRSVSSPLILNTSAPSKGASPCPITPISEDGTSMFDSEEARSTPPSSVHTRSNSSTSSSKANKTPRESEDRAETPRVAQDTPREHTASIDPHLPKPELLQRLASLPLHSSSGLRVPFGAVLRSSTSPDSAHTTIVVFLRHFWCPHDQAYVSAIRSALLRLDDAKQDCDLVLVSTGAHSLIAKYMRVLGFQDGHVCGQSRVRVSMYTDEGRPLYSALGMQEATEARVGPAPRKKDGFVGLVMRVLRGEAALANSGEINQLGGEFVFEAGADGSLRCRYAHRMASTRDHALFEELLSAAGVGSAGRSTGHDGPRARSLSFDGGSEARQQAVAFVARSDDMPSSEKPSPETIKERKKRFRHSVSWGGGLYTPAGGVPTPIGPFQ
ncbi:hypothetical protein BD626DRAFT_429843 [Schizophyllum amplum]|uniref:AhpC/TSA antioxidant enzyme-domain-containing protein n=1 Tax=Schizophyllum amplum TaxID=97359 RepID=A0A550CHJ6_9AGAR|nr:hypothetical protein BD626DRAFT_429843 [Auriculariopsis ampla]